MNTEIETQIKKLNQELGDMQKSIDESKEFNFIEALTLHQIEVVKKVCQIEADKNTQWLEKVRENFARAKDIEVSK